MDPELYKDRVRDAVLFLKGRSKDVVNRLKQEMTDHAGAREFEKAAQVRDAIFAIERVMERQVVVCPDQKDRDVMGLAWDRGKVVVTVMQVRSGQLLDTAHYPLDLGFKEPVEVLAAFVEQYYERTRDVPGSVLLSQPIENRRGWRSDSMSCRTRRVHLHHPVGGKSCGSPTWRWSMRKENWKRSCSRGRGKSGHPGDAEDPSGYGPVCRNGLNAMITPIYRARILWPPWWSLQTASRTRLPTESSL